MGIRNCTMGYMKQDQWSLPVPCPTNGRASFNNFEGLIEVLQLVNHAQPSESSSYNDAVVVRLYYDVHSIGMNSHADEVVERWMWWENTITVTETFP